MEILVVLVIAGLLASVALPRLHRLVQSIESAEQRRSIIGQIEGLGYRAYSQARPISLGGMPESPSPSRPGPVVDLPVGWKLRVAQPIRYASNGRCDGGRLTILSPDSARHSYRLEPPLCRLKPDESDEG